MNENTDRSSYVEAIVKLLQKQTCANWITAMN